jgi:2-amino-4-hydroxy-6-hydroxymethyldihydropteridine diphosphokinase
VTCHTAYIGLGANVGDRAANIYRSLELLDSAPGIRVSAASGLYETPPWGYVEQPPFLNAAARLETVLGPLQLLLALKSFEVQVGRETTFRWGPRVIDLDLLLYDDSAVQRRGLTIPHPGILGRGFVLVPLRDVFSEYRSSDGSTLDELIGRLDVSNIRRIGVPPFRARRRRQTGSDIGSDR